MSEIDGYIEWIKEEPNDKVWWGTIFHGISGDDIKSKRATNDDICDSIGWGTIFFLSINKKIYWLFKDYPDALTSKEKETFDKKSVLEKFFKNR